MANKNERFQTVVDRIDAQTNNLAGTLRSLSAEVSTLQQQLKEAQTAAGIENPLPSGEASDELSGTEEDSIAARLEAIATQLEAIGKPESTGSGEPTAPIATDENGNAITDGAGVSTTTEG